MQRRPVRRSLERRNQRRSVGPLRGLVKPRNLYDHDVATAHVVLFAEQNRLVIGTGKAGTQVEQRIVRSNAQLGRLLGVSSNGLDRTVANRDNRRSANTLDLGKNRLVLKIGRQQLTVGVKRHKDVLLKDGLAVGRTHALDM